MFTGLVEELGIVKTLTGSDPARLTLKAPMIASGAQIGDSVAVNGVCLTVTSIAGEDLNFDMVRETLSKSSLGALKTGHKVNLERALTAGKQLGGHFVLGHVDGLGKIASFARSGDTAVMRISAAKDIIRYVVSKGSIAIDGISLTVASVDSESLTIAVIPHTLENTNLLDKRVGDNVNLEVDILGKYVERFLSARMGETRGVTEQLLADAGFM
jgi:riboflavin synthase